MAEKRMTRKDWQNVLVANLKFHGENEAANKVAILEERDLRMNSQMGDNLGLLIVSMFAWTWHNKGYWNELYLKYVDTPINYDLVN